MAGGMRGRRDGHCSGRYASYWNAFLLGVNYWLNKPSKSESENFL